MDDNNNGQQPDLLAAPNSLPTTPAPSSPPSPTTSSSGMGTVPRKVFGRYLAGYRFWQGKPVLHSEVINRVQGYRKIVTEPCSLAKEGPHYGFQPLPLALLFPVPCIYAEKVFVISCNEAMNSNKVGADESSQHREFLRRLNALSDTAIDSSSSSYQGLALSWVNKIYPNIPTKVANEEQHSLSIAEMEGTLINRKVIPGYLVCRLLGGYLYANKPFQFMIFNDYANQSVINAILFLGILKLGHYMKVAPSIISASVGFGVSWHIGTGYAEKPGGSPLDMVYQTAIMWGVISPRHLFHDGNYVKLILSFVAIFAIAELILLIASRKWKLIGEIKLPVILAATVGMPPAGPANLNS
ncbi:hypothetical protein RHMOL_Rhmol03G0018300 [Rhododendron molle]|uniref:Uncharacterized protein n=1 Tax=Rhododendron molle TaxID=49168 RepID=A0ACC0PBX7_RHOML|nr:hypothetical protein RHMOL_Rhmol03G0018300 [Rhododendron molle]